MKRAVALMAVLFTVSCAIHRVETSKSLYEKARQSQQEGNDIQAIVNWKALLQETDREIAAGNYLSTNYFMRAAARIELGQWDAAFQDLKQIDLDALREEEMWIHPLYSVLMGDYYSHRNMTSVASNFYRSVLKKSTLKSSSIYVLALERDVNNSIKAIRFESEGREDAEKFKRKGYEDLAKDLEKYAEDYPFGAVPHFLLSDLYFKTEKKADALQHLMASLELGLPTSDLQKSAEFALLTLLSEYQAPAHLRSALLEKSVELWSTEGSSTMLFAGVQTCEWMRAQGANVPGDGKVRYLASRKGDKLNFLLWEDVP